MTSPVRQCAILVGGLGTRLGALTQHVPKPLMQCGDRPFLAWLMREMQRFGIEEFVLLAGHLSEEIERRIDEIRTFLPKTATIRISVEPFRAGTGGALHHARHLLDPRFLLCNGDSVFACNLARFFGSGVAHGENRILLRVVDDLDRYGSVRLDGAGARVAAFQPSGSAGTAGLINAGVYLFDHSVFAHVGPSCSLEADVLPALAAAGGLYGTVLDGYFRDIGLPGDLEQAGRELPLELLRPAVFLDRDGVINVDHGWVGSRERFEWANGAIDAIRALTDRNLHVFVVTNQSGIARGLYTEADLEGLMSWVIAQVRAQGGTIDDWRYCPMHPLAVVDAYRGVSDRRKPATGMIDELLRAWGIEPARCVLFGDQQTDMQAGQAAGLQTGLVGPQSLADIVNDGSLLPCHLTA